MTVIADDNRCVPLPTARPGEQFDLEIAGEGKFVLTRLNPQETGIGDRAELARALKESGAVVGEKPTRDRTYSDRFFPRH